MQSENPLIADIAKLLNSAAGTMAGMGREARDAARERVKEAVGGLEFVGREEFDAVKDMAARARDENEALKLRIAALEGKLAAKPPAKPAANPAANPAAKPATKL